ncbi:DNA-binding transcriptional MerR regulator [Bacillus ectoiniformans]|uniref:MerR family transcriptional regulator n=1 Tax=Bacillus ectoiniformans TaxID=1494429 RepID=UPI00195A2900|nr:MerR family DNA-binding transcriptional regulator [Bacillus ectoiniformans]MBM7648096.1 DNA-binding transcriptional MerR regulator [Bacillus ectoiniformans]
MYTISELAKEFALTTRTIRYYEELGLLKPERTSNGKRIYSKKEFAVLKLILRGKRYGFSLEEIKDMVLLFDKDRTGKVQLQKTIKYGEEKLAEVNQRMEELKEMKAEIEDLLQDFSHKLDCLRGEDG